MTRGSGFILIAASLLAPCAKVLGGSSPKSIVAARTTQSLQIDGSLSERAWESAVPISSFRQFDPEEGAEPTEQTSVRILYDDNALYVGVKCFDAHPDQIVEQLTRRDRTAQADRMSVMIDSYHDHTTAFLFQGTVSGVETDGMLSQDGRVYDVQWDAVWEFAARIDSDGWTAEYRIPFSALRFSDQDSEYVWGINFRRYIARKQETDEWVMVPRSEAPIGTLSSVSKMGHLSGITGIHPPLHLELLPYEVSRVNSFAQPSPFSTLREFKGTGGLDLKYGVTNNSTLDLALNPDFGQVEVDQAVLNLTVFETFYPEKRPLFLEGAQLFSFGNMFDNQEMRLFYSRRVGRTPSNPHLLDSGYTFTDNPQTTAILGAGKFTGRTDNGLTFGLFSAATAEEDALEKNLNGAQLGPFMVEPRASYNVARIKQDVLENSSVGAMVTGAFKDTRFPAFSGGTDWNLKFNGGDYLLDGYLAGANAFDPSGAGESGAAGRIGFARAQADHWLYFSLYDFASRNYSINDLGFYSQPHEHGGYTEVLYKEDHAPDPVLRYSLIGETDYRWNWDRINTVKQLEFQTVWQFRNFWMFTLDTYHDLPAYDDANRGIVGLYLRPQRNRIILTIQTDSRMEVSGTVDGGYYTTPKGLSTLFGGAQLSWKPVSWIEFNPAVNLVRTRNEEAWVIPLLTADGFNLFGDRDLDQYDLSLRGTLTFTRALSVQFFTQVFLAKGHYSNFKKLLGPEDLPAFDYAGSPGYVDPDFNEQILNANFVLRWEYLPGSTIFLVWTQERYGNDGLYDRTLGDNFSETFRLPMNNVFLAKITYWWTP